jgi:hypothetical protein
MFLSVNGTSQSYGVIPERRRTEDPRARVATSSDVRARAGEVLQGPGYAPEVAHYLFNFVKGDAATESALREQAARFLRLRMWGIDADERHGNALAPGDLILIYLGAPEREFIGRAELASAAHEWTPSEAQMYPGDSPSGVLLAQVEEWDPPVPMSAVLSQLASAETAKADFAAGVVRITAGEYETALAVAAGRARSTG